MADTSDLIAALAQAVDAARTERRNQPRTCPTCPTDADIDAALADSLDRLHRKD